MVIARRRQYVNPETMSNPQLDSYLTEGAALNQQGITFTPVDEGQSAPLWDNVKEEWTHPLPFEQRNFFLSKTVFRCSVCTYAVVRRNMVDRHISQTATISSRHKNASMRIVEDERETRYACTSCGFKTRRGEEAVEKHINDAIRQAGLHANAEEVYMLRFAIAPLVGSVQKVADLEPLKNARPIGVQQLDGDAPHPRRRRRRRSRSKRNGNG